MPRSQVGSVSMSTPCHPRPSDRGWRVEGTFATAQRTQHQQATVNLNLNDRVNRVPQRPISAPGTATVVPQVRTPNVQWQPFGVDPDGKQLFPRSFSSVVRPVQNQTFAPPLNPSPPEKTSAASATRPSYLQITSQRPQQEHCTPLPPPHSQQLWASSGSIVQAQCPFSGALPEGTSQQHRFEIAPVTAAVTGAGQEPASCPSPLPKPRSHRCSPVQDCTPSANLQFAKESKVRGRLETCYQRSVLPLKAQGPTPVGVLAEGIIKPHTTTISAGNSANVLDLSRLPLHPQDLSAIWQILSADEHRETLLAATTVCFSSNPLGPEGVHAILHCHLPSTMSHIVGLDLFDVGFTDDCIPSLLSSIRHGGELSNVTKLKLGDNLITAAGARALVEGLLFEPSVSSPPSAPETTATASADSFAHVPIGAADLSLVFDPSLDPTDNGSHQPLFVFFPSDNAQAPHSIAPGFDRSSTPPAQTFRLDEDDHLQADLTHAPLFTLSSHRPRSAIQSATAQLHQLHLGGNPIGDSGTAAVSRLLASSSPHAITHLGLRSVGMTQSGAFALAEHLWGNQFLADLQLKDNLLGDQAVLALSKAFSTMPSLTSLELCGIHMSAASIGSFFDCLSRSPSTLRALDLSANPLGDEGAKAAAMYFASSKASALTSLDLSSTSMNASGADVLCAAMTQGFEQKNLCLTTLRMNQNNFANSPMTSLGQLLESPYSTLLSLDLSESYLPSKAFANICSALTVGTPRLKHLNLASNFALSKGGAAIANLLQSNQSLLRLMVNDNDIDEPTMELVIQSVEQLHCSLREFSFGGESAKAPFRQNALPEKGRMRVKVAMEKIRARPRSRPATHPFASLPASEASSPSISCSSTPTSQALQAVGRDHSHQQQLQVVEQSSTSDFHFPWIFGGSGSF